MSTLHQQCAFCKKAIKEGEHTNEHHPHYVSLGGQGTPTQTLHHACHVAVHADDWKAWGRIGGQTTAATKVWAFNLLNVRTHPAHELNRQFYLMHYSH